MTTLRTLAALSILALPLAACSAGDPGPTDDDSSCRTGKCDDLDKPDSEVPDSPCDGVLVDESGRDNQKVAGRLNDPLANFAFKTGDDCPVTLQDIIAKLKANDTEGCDPATEGAGLMTRFISETAQATGTPTNYRLVTTRRCGGRPAHGLVFSIFGVQAGAAELPPNVEIIAFDEEAGVFNYYEADGQGEIAFFGNSKDMLRGPQGNVRRCAGCHTGGGLVMKELNAPWVHWEGHMDHPGAAELATAHAALLGRKSNAIEFEGVVSAGNRAWNQTRLDFMKESGSVKDILRPLFCTVEVNVDNGADFESPVRGGPGGDEMSSIPFDSLLDPQLKGFGSIPVEFSDYDAQIKANGQNVPGVEGAIDTVFDYVFIERSHADNDYVEKLIAAGIVDDEFVKDVLTVDLTRPIFSDDRCGLLDFAPVLAADQLSPAALEDGFLANIGSAEAGTPAAELANNLQSTGGHDEKVAIFIANCNGIGSAKVVENALAVTSLNRKTARSMQVFEFPASFPDDQLDVAPGTRLDPTSCLLTTEFVPLTTEAAGGDEPEEPGDPSAASCAHDVCEAGDALDPTCEDSCVATVCEKDAFCCNNSWDATCVQAAAASCDRSC